MAKYLKTSIDRKIAADKRFSAFTIDHRETIREAFKKLDSNKEQFVVILNNNCEIMGVVTDGDFRRAIWNSISLEDSISTITNRNFISLPIDYQ